MKSVSALAAALPLIVVLLSDYTAALAPGECKVLPSDKNWPEEAKWKALPGVMARGPQAKMKRPDYTSVVKSFADVQQAVNFARTNNIRLSIIHSGHDGMSRNDAPTGLLIHMEKLKGIRLETSFTPSEKGVESAIGKTIQSAPKRRDTNAPLPIAVTIGAGMTTEEINNAIASAGVFTLGAEHGEVGVAGGWTQCGGHAPMSSAHGLGTDAVLEFQVVTADGQLKIANAKSNRDLFWALRGGCGSTYGVVVQATIKAFPSPKFTVTKFTINATTADGIWEPSAYLHNQFPELSEQGVQGYYLIFPKQLIGIFHTVGNLATAGASAKIWDPILAKIKSMPALEAQSVVATYKDYKNYKEYFDDVWGEKETKGGKKVKRWETRSMALARRHGPDSMSEMKLSQSMAKIPGDGRLMDKDVLKHPNLKAALQDSMITKGFGMVRGSLIGGGEVFRSKPEDSSVHPTWRKAYVAIWSDKDLDKLIKISPNMGAYINEASWNETNWKEAFWGSNYNRLSKIKDKYDPGMLFYVTPGINADMMEGNASGKLCRVATAKQSIYPPMGDNYNIRS